MAAQTTIRAAVLAAVLALGGTAAAQWELEIPLQEGVLPSEPDEASDLIDEVEPVVRDEEPAADRGIDPTAPPARSVPRSGPRAREPASARPAAARPAADPATPTSTASETARAGLPEAVRVGRVQLPGITSATLFEHWQARRRHAQALDPALARREADALLEAKALLGVEALPTVAAALVREGRRDLERQDAQDALEKAELALRLAPGLPEAHWFRGRALLAQGTAAWPAAGAEVWQALRGSLADLPARRAAQGNLVFLAWTGLAAAGAVLLALFLLRSLRLFAHDFHHLFPAGILRAQTTALAAVILLAPWVLGLGPLLVALTAAAAAWLYLGRRERVLAGAALVVLALTPWTTGFAVRTAAFWSTPAADVWRLERTGHWEGPAASLSERAGAGHASWPELFALARWHKREGRLDSARVLFQSVVDLAPDSGVAWNGLGVTLYAQGDVDGARAAFERAVAADSTLAAAWNNLARIHFRTGELGRGQEARRRARALDRALVDAHADLDARLNVGLADAGLPDRVLAELADRHADMDGVRREVGIRLAGLLPGAEGGWLGLGGLLGLLALGLALQRLHPSRACERCGRSACRRCDGHVGDAALCGQCVSLTQQQEAIPPAARVAKEAAIRRRETLGRWVGGGLGLLLPGVWDVLRGRPVRGAVVLAVFASGLAGLLLQGGPVPSGVAPGTGVPPLGTMFSGLVAGAAWLSAAAGLRRGRVRAWR